MVSWSRNPVGIPQIWWLYGQDPDWDTSGRVAYLDTASVMAFCGKIPFGSFFRFVVWLGYLQIPVGISQIVKIPVGISQVLWFRGQDRD